VTVPDLAADRLQRAGIRSTSVSGRKHSCSLSLSSAAIASSFRSARIIAYDLVLDLGVRRVRIQCKTGRRRNGAVCFPTRSTRANAKRVTWRTYAGEVDAFAVHCPETDRVYIVPIDEARAALGTLRVTPSRNGQEKGVRWATDYELTTLVERPA
jgi:hypothetical protein